MEQGKVHLIELFAHSLKYYRTGENATRLLEEELVGRENRDTIEKLLRRWLSQDRDGRRMTQLG